MIPSPTIYLYTAAAAGESLSEVPKDARYVKVASSVKEIRDYAFYEYRKLTQMDFSDAVQLESIGVEAFRGCRSLETVTLPPAVHILHSGAFWGVCRLQKSIQCAAGGNRSPCFL